MIKSDQEYLFAFRRFTLHDGTVIGIRNDVIRYWGKHRLQEELERFSIMLKAQNYKHNPGASNGAEDIETILKTQSYSTDDLAAKVQEYFITPMYAKAVIPDGRKKLPTEPSNEIVSFTLKDGTVKSVSADIVQILGEKDLLIALESQSGYEIAQTEYDWDLLRKNYRHRMECNKVNTETTKKAE